MNSSLMSTDYARAKTLCRCPADHLLNGLDYEQPLEARCDVGPTRNYKNLLEYCTEVADCLPQRQAFYTFDLADVLWKVQEWKRRLPKVDIFYAVKANADPVLLRLLVIIGASFDCSSEGEIRLVLEAGASPSDIIFAHTIKTEEELRFAREQDVELLTFDNEDELRKIRRIYPEAKCVIRIRPSFVNCSFDLSDKFGCSEQEAEALLKLAKQLDLLVVGVSFHVGALCSDPKSYVTTIHQCRRLFDLASTLGFSFTLLDIGGGFLGQRGTESLFQEVASEIWASLEEYFPGDGMRFIAEPGNYIAVSAVRLVTTIIGRRFLKTSGEGQVSRHYFLNDGIYGSFFKGIECYDLRIKPLLEESDVRSRSEHDCRLFGQTCCSEDVIATHATLPDLQVGERIVWENVGSYSRGICSTFCGMPFPVPQYVFVRNERLNADWMKDQKIEDFLKKHVVFVEQDSF